MEKKDTEGETSVSFVFYGFMGFMGGRFGNGMGWIYSIPNE
jgi:hypothetical protein